MGSGNSNAAASRPEKEKGMEEATQAAVAPSATERLQELKAQQAAKQLEYDTLNARHTALWQLRKQAKLEREDYITQN
jgi:hypothetical protein